VLEGNQSMWLLELRNYTYMTIITSFPASTSWVVRFLIVRTSSVKSKVAGLPPTEGSARGIIGYPWTARAALRRS